MVDIDELQLITGIDLPIEAFGITLHQPRVREIAMLGEQNYFVALSIFRMSKDQLKIQSPDVTNWMIFKESLTQKIEGIKDLNALLSNFLQLFLVQKLIIGPNSLIIQDKDKLVNIEPEQFDDFQALISQVGGASLLQSTEETYNPLNRRAAEIAEKLKKAHKRLAAQQPKSKGKGFLTRYIRAVAVATANSLEDVCNMTMLQLNDVMQTYLAYEAYDLDIKSRLAGAKNQDKLVHWMMKDLDGNEDSIGTLEG